MTTLFLKSVCYTYILISLQPTRSLICILNKDEICHVRRAVTEICNITYFISAKIYLIKLIITYFVAPDPVSPAEPGRDRRPLRGSRLLSYNIINVTLAGQHMKNMKTES